jgi:hypothetical protein
MHTAFIGAKGNGKLTARHKGHKAQKVFTEGNKGKSPKSGVETQ